MWKQLWMCACRWTFHGMPLLFVLSGCSTVHFEHGRQIQDDRALVFGRILLVRDGEAAAINVGNSPIALKRRGSGEEPVMITEPFEKTGRFYWNLQPGDYLLEITIYRQRADIIYLTFSVPVPSRAYYFGDMIVSGRKYFDTFGGMNIRDYTVKFEDNFEVERAELLRRNPQLMANADKLEVQLDYVGSKLRGREGLQR